MPKVFTLFWLILNYTQNPDVEYLVILSFLSFSATTILKPKRIMDMFSIFLTSKWSNFTSILPKVFTLFSPRCRIPCNFILFCLFSNYKSSTEEDHGQVLCWASNGLGEQIQPCVFRVVPLASPAPPKDCRVRSFK